MEILEDVEPYTWGLEQGQSGSLRGRWQHHASRLVHILWALIPVSVEQMSLLHAASCESVKSDYWEGAEGILVSDAAVKSGVRTQCTPLASWLLSRPNVCLGDNVNGTPGRSGTSCDTHQPVQTQASPTSRLQPRAPIVVCLMSPQDVYTRRHQSFRSYRRASPPPRMPSVFNIARAVIYGS